MCAERTPHPSPARSGEEAAFGEILRRSRESAGLSLEDVSRRTRIATHHIEALEREDPAALPAGPFGRSYLRACAEVLGLDPEPLLAAYRLREHPQDARAPVDDRRMLEQLSQAAARSARSDEQPRVRRPGAGLAVAAAVVILAVSGWLAVSRWRPGPSTADPPPPGAPPSPHATISPRPAGPAPSAARPAPPAPPAARPTPPARESPAAPAAIPPTGSLSVAGFGVGTGILSRGLLGRADRFREGTQVVFWTEVLGGRPGHVVRHIWFRGGRAVMKVTLRVGGPHWRTQSSLVLPRGSAGTWTVEARTSDGRLLARNDFACEPSRPGGG